jgi:acyl-coenzyme A synthetase/AMP-(fatty) acid ligase
MEKLPRNATGKILKRELRELANQAGVDMLIYDQP